MSDKYTKKAFSFFSKLFTALAIGDILYTAGIERDEYVIHCTAKTEALIGNKLVIYIQNSLKLSVVQPMKLTLKGIELITDMKMIIKVTTQAKAELG